ncbi:MAG: response regulator [Bradyrhizobium sp.]|uniref:response regulator n=1 Tax=Bradyrhizobium sp. TaxID=376 RepID=UPI0025C0EDAD|nr:response regulator [Bradyrhizobium sp.]MBI5260801.1 response regulator [Bradyrhizobium sp.]
MSLFQLAAFAAGLGAFAVPAPLAGRRVLVVEDEYFLADDISRELNLVGAQILGPVNQIDEASTLLESGERVDAAVLDVNVASEMVFPLARALRSRNVPFLFTTGYDRNVVAPEFDDVVLLSKPLDIAALVRELSDLLQKR